MRFNFNIVPSQKKKRKEKKKVKLQTKPIQFGGLWILHPEIFRIWILPHKFLGCLDFHPKISEFRFNPLKFRGVWILHSQILKFRGIKSKYLSKL